jgi:hypothetical protein
MQITDPLSGYPLQKGIFVCDSSGNTGVIGDNGIVGGFARLTDTPKSVLTPDTFNTYFKPVPPSQLQSSQLQSRRS